MSLDRNYCNDNTYHRANRTSALFLQLPVFDGVSNPRLRDLDILIFADYYLPSYKAGGPIRSLSSLIEALGDEIRFHLVTRDRDLSDEEPFFGLSPDGWKKVGKAEVLYCAPGRRGRQAMRRAVCDRSWDLVYVNSLFSPTYSILPLVWWRIGRLRSKLFVIAPKGECHPGALAGKARKKALFLRMARLFGLHRHVRWHASTSQEANDIASSLRLDLLQRADIGIAPDIPLHLQGDPSHTPA